MNDRTLYSNGTYYIVQQNYVAFGDISSSSSTHNKAKKAATTETEKFCYYITKSNSHLDIFNFEELELFEFNYMIFHAPPCGFLFSFLIFICLNYISCKNQKSKMFYNKQLGRGVPPYVCVDILRLNIIN